MKTIASASRDFGIDAGLNFAATVHNFTDESYFGSEMLVSMSFDNFSALPSRRGRASPPASRPPLSCQRSHRAATSAQERSPS